MGKKWQVGLTAKFAKFAKNKSIVFNNCTFC